MNLKATRHTHTHTACGRRAVSNTRTVFVGQTAGGEFFAVCTSVVLQVRGARGPA